MTDADLLIAGIFVFLMVIVGLVFTVTEFRKNR